MLAGKSIERCFEPEALPLAPNDQFLSPDKTYATGFHYVEPGIKTGDTDPLHSWSQGTTQYRRPPLVIEREAEAGGMHWVDHHSEMIGCRLRVPG